MTFGQDLDFRQMAAQPLEIKIARMSDSTVFKCTYRVKRVHLCCSLAFCVQSFATFDSNIRGECQAKEDFSLFGHVHWRPSWIYLRGVL